MSVRRLLSELVPFNPARLANNAARYSLDGAPGDSTFLVDGSNRVQLIADRSGNSAVNCLSIDGNNSNGATIAELTAFGTGNFSVSIRVRQTPIAANKRLFGSGVGGFVFSMLGSANGQFVVSQNGGFAIVSTGAVTSYQDSVLGYTRSGTTGTFYLDGVACGTDTDSANYTVGITKIGISTAGNSALSGNIFWARVYNAALTGPQMAADAAGSLQSNAVLNADFRTASKLAATVLASTGQTVTIDTTGDLGARISGERDLYQGTAAKQPIYSIAADGVPIATFDGSNDYLKSAPFALVQPESVYFTGSQVTWTNTDQLLGGNAATTMEIIQSGLTPAVVISAGSSVASNTGLTLGTRAVIAAEFNEASSSLAINKTTATTGNAGAGNANGITVGAAFDGSVPGNITLSELLVRSVADPTSLQLRIAQYYMRRYNIPQ